MEIVLAIVNVTSNFSSAEPPITNSAYATWAIAFVSIAIGYFTIRFSQKQNQRNALMEIFKMLNNEEHKYSETLIIDRFRENDLYNVGILSENFRSSANIVLRNYDQLGLLASKHGLIPNKDDVLEMFGTLVVISHFVLFQEINRRRLMQERYYMVNFTNLAIDCYHYWKDIGQIPRHPLTNQEIAESVINSWKESLPR